MSRFSALMEGGGGPAGGRRRRGNKARGPSSSASASASAGHEGSLRATCLAHGFAAAEVERGLEDMAARGLNARRPLAVIAFLEERRAQEARMARDAASSAAAQQQQQQQQPEEEEDPRAAVARLQGVMREVEDVPAVLDGMQLWLGSASARARGAVFESDALQMLFERVLQSFLVAQGGDRGERGLRDLEAKFVQTLVLLLQAPRAEAAALARAVRVLVDGVGKLRHLAPPGAAAAPLPITPVAASAASVVLDLHGAFAARAAAAEPATAGAAGASSLRHGAQQVALLERSVLPFLPRGDALMVSAAADGGAGGGNIAHMFRLRDNGKKIVDLSARCIDLARQSPRDGGSGGSSSSSSSSSKGYAAAVPVETLIANAEARLRGAVAAETAAQGRLDGHTAGLTAGMSSPQASRLTDIKKELAAFKEQRRQLMAQLEDLDRQIVARSEEERALEGSILSQHSAAAEEAGVLQQENDRARELVRVERIKLETLNDLKRFRDMVQRLSPAAHADEPAVPTAVPVPDVKDANPVSEWRSRTFLAAERYLGVEAACIALLRARVETSKARVDELAVKISNLETMGMSSLADASKAQQEQEHRNQVEDNRALGALTASAAETLAQIAKLFTESKLDRAYRFPAPVLAALRRAATHASAIGVNAPFASDALVLTAPEDPLPTALATGSSAPSSSSTSSSATAQPAKGRAGGQPAVPASSTPAAPAAPAPNAVAPTPVAPKPAPAKKKAFKGWGAVPAAPVAPSLADILAEEEERAKAKAQAEEDDKAKAQTEEEDKAQDAKPEAAATPKATTNGAAPAKADDEPANEKVPAQAEVAETEVEAEVAETEVEAEVAKTEAEVAETEIDVAETETEVAETEAAADNDDDDQEDEPEEQQQEQQQKEDEDKNEDKEEVVAAAAAAVDDEKELPPSPPEFTVYDDDAALGKACPSLAGLEFFNGPALEAASGKVLVLTFYSKLNKSDFCTLTLLDQVRAARKDAINVVAISRDQDAKPDAFLAKYQGKYMAESPAPNNDESLKTVSIGYQLAFDPDSAFSAALKDAMKRVVMVGDVVIVDASGHIRWYETFVRGENPAGRFLPQLDRLIADRPLLSNGPAPAVEDDDDEEELVGDIPDDLNAAMDGY